MLKDELLADSESFRKTALAVARIMPGIVSCTSYSAAVTRIADICGVDYKVYAGFCIPNNYARYEEDLKGYKNAKDKGVEHPVFPSHAFVMIDDKFYDYMNNTYDGINHLDYEEINVK